MSMYVSSIYRLTQTPPCWSGSCKVNPCLWARQGASPEEGRRPRATNRQSSPIPGGDEKHRIFSRGGGRMQGRIWNGARSPSPHRFELSKWTLRGSTSAAPSAGRKREGPGWLRLALNKTGSLQSLLALPLQVEAPPFHLGAGCAKTRRGRQLSWAPSSREGSLLSTRRGEEAKGSSADPGSCSGWPNNASSKANVDQSLLPPPPPSFLFAALCLPGPFMEASAGKGLSPGPPNWAQFDSLDVHNTFSPPPLPSPPSL